MFDRIHVNILRMDEPWKNGQVYYRLNKINLPRHTGITQLGVGNIYSHHLNYQESFPFCIDLALAWANGDAALTLQSSPMLACRYL